MFTVQQIKAAHSKVKSGADFPSYIQEIKALGVTSYEAYVRDGHVNYYGANNYTVTSAASYAPLTIINIAQAEAFKVELLAHQQGKTDYLAFIQMCATCGIEKWVVAIDTMTCTYYDTTGNEILKEIIPH